MYEGCGDYKENTWKIKYDPSDSDAVEMLCTKFGYSEIAAKVLCNRGIKTAEAVQGNLRSYVSLWRDPMGLKDMDRAAKRVIRAINEGERIVIYGDYDADGITSTALLYLYLEEKGAAVDYYIPERLTEGYGMSKEAINKIAEFNVSLIVTVDTGVTAIEEIDYAAKKGIDVVVTDHHECRATLPRACAVVDPHRPDCEYGFSDLAGVGVAFKLICAVEELFCIENGTDPRMGFWDIFARYVDLAAIGTVADVMPLVDENRYIVAAGLKKIENIPRVAMSALMDASEDQIQKYSQKPQPQPKKRKITSSFIGFNIAPKINAAGRMGRVSDAISLFIEQDYDRAYDLAVRLCEMNFERQKQESRITDEAEQKIDEVGANNKYNILVMDDNNWHHGVVGIVASRISEKYNLPTILISFEGSLVDGEESPFDIGKGSGRSIKGLNLVEALADSEDLLVKYGGHELAAGLTIKRCELEAFKMRINQYAKEHADAGMSEVVLDADLEISVSDITLPLCYELLKFEPFGSGNPTPKFVIRDATLTQVTSIGNGKHAKIFAEKDGQYFSAVWFGQSEACVTYHAGERIDLLFSIDINEFRGNVSAQMLLDDIKYSEEYKAEWYGMKRRFEEVMNGAPISPDEDIIPDRNDFAYVYNILMREMKGAKHEYFSDANMMTLMRFNPGKKVNRTKLLIIYSVFNEMGIFKITFNILGGYHNVEVKDNKIKINLKDSSILQRLAKQCQ